MEELVEPLFENTLEHRLLMATCGTCTCETKTNELRFHAELCHYRLFAEAHTRIEELKGIYDSAVKGRQDFRNAYRAARITSDTARIERLEAALKPFALEADNYDYGDNSGPDIETSPDQSSIWEINGLLVGHLRAARAALTQETINGQG